MHFTRRYLTASLAAASTTLLTSCGTILYPNRRTARKNETMSGDIDWFVFGLNTVGLVFFLVPGIIAFAVDFGTGAIFVPEGGEILDKTEETLFDELNEEARISMPIQSDELLTTLEDITGHDLRGVRLMAREIDTLSQANVAYTQLRRQSKALPS